MLEKLGGELLDLRISELGRSAISYALPAIGSSCCSCCSCGRRRLVE